MSKETRLDAPALARELARLPALTAPSASVLRLVQLALARAIATGQPADQLAKDLGTPPGWAGADFVQRSRAVVSSVPVEPAALEDTAGAPSPAWLQEAAAAAVQGAHTTRVALLSQEPTALGGLGLPPWARALKPAAVYGPVTASGAGVLSSSPKWVVVFASTKMVEFVRGADVLCVLPLSNYQLTSAKHIGVSAGSAWVAAHPFAPSGSFAGLTIQSGEVTCDQPLALAGSTITVPPSATLRLSLAPAAAAAAPGGFPASVTPPSTLSVDFPPAGTPTMTFDHCAGTIYGEAIACDTAHLPVLYNSELKLLYLRGHCAQTRFNPKTGTGKFFAIAGSAPILSAGWALSVSESTTPATLGTAASSGDLALVFGAGIRSKREGAPRDEPLHLGTVIAQSAALVVAGFSGAPPGVVLEQSFELWNYQESTTSTTRRSKLLAGRRAGQPLLYALAGDAEALLLTATAQLQLDRPLLATGSRLPAIFLETSIAFIRNNAGNRLQVFSSKPLPQTTGPDNSPARYPLALDNAILETTQPLLLHIGARADANFNATSGVCDLVLGYRLLELYLPDPYTGALAPPHAAARDASATDAGEATYLLAAIRWTAVDAVTLRLGDTAHTQPAKAPPTEAGSTVFPHAASAAPADLALVAGEVENLAALVPLAAEPAAIASQAPTFTPPPPALASTPLVATLLDVSTRASQLGVGILNVEGSAARYTIDGLSVRGPASLLPLATLPAIAWEPMYNEVVGNSTGKPTDTGVDDQRLLHPPNDGPLNLVRSRAATLIPIAPLQSLQAVLDAGTGGSQAILTLPFGMVAFLDNKASDGNSVLPNVGLVQPVFAANGTPAGSIYTGAWQLSFTAPDPGIPDPVLAGRTYLRTHDDNPKTSASYGEQVLGTDVAKIFSSRFDPTGGATGGGVPLRRYDLTGYGASTFSEWSNANPAPTDVIKSFFHVLIGRTSHEVIQVQSLLYPWAVKVVRTITIDRLASGAVHRYDSGWQAASDGLFQYPAATGISRGQIHSGLISGVINVKNIRQLGLPLQTPGTSDPPAKASDPTPPPKNIAVQPVTFDADVIIQPQHKVVQGGVVLPDMSSASHTCVPSSGITGYIGLQYKYRLSLEDMAGFAPLRQGAGGSIRAVINVGAADSLLRAVAFDATPVHDTAPGGDIGIACAVRGLPALPAQGSWSIASRTQSQAAPVALDATQAAPVVQPNNTTTATPGDQIHFADPADIFRLAEDATTAPAKLYGFLQATGTQSNFLSRPILTVGSKQLKLGDALNVAHAGALLGAIGNFPGIDQCLKFLGDELDTLTNHLQAPLLTTKQQLNLKPEVYQNPVKLIDISIARVDLFLYWQNDDPGQPVDPAYVVIALGQPTAPSWSLDIKRVAIGLTLPALSDDPVIWLRGNFHADADSAPSFPDLEVKFAGLLDPLTQFFTVLQNLAHAISPAGSSAATPQLTPALTANDDGDADDGSGAGLHTHVAEGKLTVSDDFSLPSIPLGPGTIQDVSLNIGASLDILALAISFGVSIGTRDAPCHWIVDPLSGTIALGAGIKNNKLDIFVEAGIGLGLAIDLGIASGSASVVIAISVDVNGSAVTLLLLLTGQAQVDVLGGVASASLSLTCGMGLSIAAPNATMIGTAKVGIHISICWVVSIDFSGSWTFQKTIPLHS